MGTEHLKARCICTFKPGRKNDVRVDNPGCPVHPKSTFIPVDEDLELPGDDGFDVINKARHYNSHPSGVEAIDICRHLTGDWFNAFKYVFRADHKAGKQDIEKAIYYIKDAVVHSIPMKLPSWTEAQDQLLIQVINHETLARASFFLAFDGDDPYCALLNAEKILAGYE